MSDLIQVVGSYGSLTVHPSSGHIVARDHTDKGECNQDENLEWVFQTCLST